MLCSRVADLQTEVVPTVCLYAWVRSYILVACSRICCFERGDLLGFQASSEVLCRTAFRYFFNQMFLQRSDAPSKPPKLLYTPVFYINHERCVVSIKMASSHWRPHQQRCVLRHGFSFLRDCPIRLHNRKHAASRYSGTHDKVSQGGIIGQMYHTVIVPFCICICYGL